jgi:hypothetical protein
MPSAGRAPARRQKGFRARALALVTTLLDAVAYPAKEIAAAYLRSWRLEMCLDALKTTLGLDALRCKRPALMQRELLALLIAHNVARAVMPRPRARSVPRERLRFPATLDGLRSFCGASEQAPSAALRKLLWAEILRVTAARPGAPLRAGFGLALP